MSVRRVSGLVVLVVFGLALVGGIWYFSSGEDKKPESTQTTQQPSEESNMQLNSSDFAHNRLIPAKYTCKGDNVNPPLQIKGVPVGTKSLAIIMHDPDAPGGDWTHWTVWNIDPTTSDLKSGDLPPGAVEGMTDFGSPGYGGPCPPSGTHRYEFELYALDTVLDLKPDAVRKTLEQAMDGHTLDTAELIGLFANK